MRFYITRHGLSEGNVNVSNYATTGDPHVALTKTGWQQLIDTGMFFDHYLRSQNAAPPQKIWVSPFMRTKQSLRAMIEGFSRSGNYIAPDQTPIHEHYLLAEQSFGAMPYMKYSGNFVKRQFGRLAIAFSRATHKHSPFMSPTPMGESPLDLCKRIESFIHRLHKNEAEKGENNVLIVAHGAVIKAFMMQLCDLPMTAWTQLKIPGNGDLFLFDNENESGEWRVTRLYDGQNAREISENPVAAFSSTLRTTDLPPLPKSLSRSPLSRSLLSRGPK